VPVYKAVVEECDESDRGFRPGEDVNGERPSGQAVKWSSVRTLDHTITGPLDRFLDEGG
jgi:hypothetical protein